MKFEELIEGNRLLEEMKSLRNSIFGLNEYLPKKPQKSEEQLIQSNRTEIDSIHITISESRKIFSKLILFNIRDEDMLALKEALEKRLKEYKKAFEAL